MKKRKKEIAHRTWRGLDFKDFGDKIGGGGYGAVFESKKDSTRVYRVAQLNWRAESIHRFISKRDVSPCFPTVYDYWSGVPIPPRFQPKRDFDKLEVTLMERGASDLTDLRTGGTHNDLMFMLFWSVWAANSNYGFMHRDLKLQNIVYRQLKKPVTYRFVIDSYKEWIVKTSIVPLIIDYDFASLLTTRTEERFKHGTYITAPPEALAYNLLIDERDLNVYGNGAYPEEAYDMWSLAMVWASIGSSRHILERVDFPLVYEIVVYKTGWVGVERNKLVVLTLICLFQDAILNGLFPPAHLLGKHYSKFIFTPTFRKAVNMVADKTKVHRRYRDEFYRHPRWELLKRLFSWDPLDRVDPNAPFEVLDEIKAPRENTDTFVETMATYVSSKRPFFSFSKDELFRKDRFDELADVQYIEARACSSCGAPNPAFVCPCCAQVLCGDSCHK